MRDSQNNNMSHIEPVEKFKKLTKNDRIQILLKEIQELIPAPEGKKYGVDYNPAYGGYRLVLIKIQGGAHFGCFGGNGTEARIKFDAFIDKLQTIIGTAKTIKK